MKYFKVLEIAQLIRKEVTGLEGKFPRGCTEGIESIKRYLTIIDNNEKNSLSGVSTGKGRGNSQMRQAGTILSRHHHLLYPRK